jgi:glucuronokinase
MAEAPARAALAGNPSDGYGGAVLAVSIEALRARADARVGVPRDAGAEGLLVDAAIARFCSEFGCKPVGVEFATNIPLTVGLGGSSAIVIAVLRELCDVYEVSLEADEMAALALSIEVDDLGIAAGLQDRLVQCHGGLLFMDFSGPQPRCEPLHVSLLPPLLIAWREAAGESSGVVHGDLRTRYDAHDPAVIRTLAELGDCAREARAALRVGELLKLCQAVNASFDLRQQIIDLQPAHTEMINAARRAGAAANYTGSGGAIVCVCDDQQHRQAVAAELAERLGCSTLEL